MSKSGRYKLVALWSTKFNSLTINLKIIINWYLWFPEKEIINNFFLKILGGNVNLINECETSKTANSMSNTRFRMDCANFVCFRRFRMDSAVFA